MWVFKYKFDEYGYVVKFKAFMLVQQEGRTFYSQQLWAYVVYRDRARLLVGSL